MTTQMQSTELVTLDPVQYVTETFAPFRTKLQEAKTNIGRVTHDVTTKQGYEKSKEAWRTYKDMRINSEKTRKERKDPIIKIGKLIDEVHSSIESEIKAEEEFYEQQWRAEDDRQEAIKAEKIRIEQEREASIKLALDKLLSAPTIGIGMNAAGVATLLEEVRATEITNEVFGERNVEAENAKYKTIEALQQLHAAKVAQEAQERIEAERVAKEVAEKAEETRKSNIKTKIMLIENAIAQASMLESSSEVQVVINKVTSTIIDDSFAEFKDEAEGVKARVLKALSRTMHMVQSEEAEQRAKQVNEAKPQVIQSEAVSFSSQDQVDVASSSIEKKRPTDEQIISVVALHYRVHESKAIEWLLDMDLTKASNDLLKEFAA